MPLCNKKESLSRNPAAICKMMSCYKGDYSALLVYTNDYCFPTGLVPGSITSETITCKSGERKLTLLPMLGLHGSGEVELQTSEIATWVPLAQKVLVCDEFGVKYMLMSAHISPCSRTPSSGTLMRNVFSSSPVNIVREKICSLTLMALVRAAIRSPSGQNSTDVLLKATKSPLMVEMLDTVISGPMVSHSSGIFVQDICASTC